MKKPQPIIILLAVLVGLLVWYFSSLPSSRREPAQATPAAAVVPSQKPQMEASGSGPKGAPSQSPGQASAMAPSSTKPAPAAALPSEVESVLAAARDTSRPIEEREGELIELSFRKDAAALAALKAVGDARVYLNFVAIEAIGNFRRSPEQAAAAAYLQGKLKDPDSQVAGAAIRAYAQLTTEEAVPELGGALQANRVRPDGHQETVCTAAVLALRDIGSPEAVPALLGELQRVDEKGWSLEYGSHVVDALKKTATPEGRAGAAAYAARLAARLPADEVAQAYYRKKIAEAEQVAGK